jgi:hypothetical protein
MPRIDDPSSEPPGATVRRLALGGAPAVLREDEVFIRSHRGRLEAAAVAAGRTRLPRRLRTLLLLVDGRASVGELRHSLSRYRSLDESLDMLHKMALIEPLPPLLGV